MNKEAILQLAKNLDIKQNVSLQVIDQKTGEVVQEHSGHNAATNSLLYGIAHHLIGDFMPNEGTGLNPGYSMLTNYVPKYISLGTMGLLNQDQDIYGLPAGIGDTIPNSDDPEYIALRSAMLLAKENLELAEEALADECPLYPATTACESCQVCSDRIQAKKDARDQAKELYESAYEEFVTYTEEARFIEYMNHAPGYGADGYSEEENNGRDYFGLGYAYTSYEVTGHYYAKTQDHPADIVTYKGLVYKCIKDTPDPASVFDTTYWEVLPDSEQPSLGTTIKLELSSPSFPRVSISYRDVVPEYQAEKPKTIDIVYSAMISTGALAQFRPEGKDYIFITEAGLWSKKFWSDGNENGLLAGYRIFPPSESNWDMTKASNRQILKENILKVGKNQVVQVVWKIQIGSIDQFTSSGSSDIPIKYSDNIWYTLQSGYQYTDMTKVIYNHLYSSHQNSDNNLPDLPARFMKSDVKRGNPVPQTYSKTDEIIYLDFDYDEDEMIQTVWWWTSSGNVTPTTNSQPQYWFFHYYTYSSAFYYLDFRNFYVGSGISLIDGFQGINIFYQYGITHVTIDLTGTVFNGGRLGFYSDYGSSTKPVLFKGLDQSIWINRQEIFESSMIIYGNLDADNIINYYQNGRATRLGNISGFTFPNSIVYARNYILAPEVYGVIYIVGQQSQAFTIDVSNWDLVTCEILHVVVSISSGQPITVVGFDTWKNTSNLKNIDMIFSGITKVESDFSVWDVSNVYSFKYAFQYTDWDREVVETISSWDVSSGVYFDYMFHDGLPNIKDYTFLDNWDVYHGAEYTKMFPYPTSDMIFPRWNGWIDTDGTFVPNRGHAPGVTIKFRGLISNQSNLPETAEEGDGYYIITDANNYWYYHNGTWTHAS